MVPQVFQVFKTHLSAQQFLGYWYLLVKSGPENPTSGFVLSSEALRSFPVIESVLPKFIRAIICFRPWVPYSVPLLSTKDDNSPATISICVSE